MTTAAEVEPIARAALVRLDCPPALLKVEDYLPPRVLKNGDKQFGNILLVCDVSGIPPDVKTFNFLLNNFFLRLPEEIRGRFGFSWRSVAEGRKAGLIP